MERDPQRPEAVPETRGDRSRSPGMDVVVDEVERRERTGGADGDSEDRGGMDVHPDEGFHEVGVEGEGRDRRGEDGDRPGDHPRVDGERPPGGTTSPTIVKR